MSSREAPLERNCPRCPHTLNPALPASFLSNVCYVYIAEDNFS